MQKKTILALLAVLPLIFMLAAANEAEARRLGGGRSFGGSKAFSSPFSKPVAPSKQAAPGQINQSQTNQSQAKGVPGRTPSRFGGLGGMFGGLLMGGLLGSLFFGGGLAGPNFMDVLLIGGGLFLLFRFLRSRRPAGQTPGDQPLRLNREENGFGEGWSNISSQEPGAIEGIPATPAIPDGFDQDNFLEGAKVVYARLQGSWDKRDLEDIKSFTIQEVYEEIARQAAEDPTPGRTEIPLLHARLLEVKEVDGETMATVLYDALLREDAHAKMPEQTREVWHFTRPTDPTGSEWKLAGIQQLAE